MAFQEKKVFLPGAFIYSDPAGDRQGQVWITLTLSSWEYFYESEKIFLIGEEVAGVWGAGDHLLSKCNSQGWAGTRVRS